MKSINGYFDGSVVRPLEKVDAKQNQKVIITLTDEFIENRQIGAESAKGILSKYANPALIGEEEGAWERAVAENNGVV